MFWSKRKNAVEKNNASGKNKIAIDLEEGNDKLKEKKSKKFDRNPSLFMKLRKSFVKAKSMDNSDVSIKRNNLVHKHSSDNLDSSEQIKSLKGNSKSLRRMFSSTKPKLVNVPTLSATTVKENTESTLVTTVTTNLTTATETPTTDFQKCSISASRTSTGTRLPISGIINHGNTCYINSIIQCLNSIDVLVKYFVLDQYKSSLSSLIDLPQSSQANIKHKDNVALLLSFTSFLKSLWLKDLNCDILSNDFKMKLAATERSFRCNDQQDAQEFLLFLLNYCHETLKLSENRVPVRYKDGKYNLCSEAEKIWSQNRSIIHRLFVTHQQLTITCPGCSSRQYKLEPHLCLSLPVPAKTMEPLYYCFIEKDGSQICAAMWINTVSLVQYVRANIAHKFRIDVNKVIIMLITESGYGKCFQDSEQAVDLLSPDNANHPMSNLWNGIVALEISSTMSNSNCREYTNPMESKNNHKSIRQMKISNSPVQRTNSSSTTGTNRHSGHYDNFEFDELRSHDSINSRDETNSQTNIRNQDDQYQRANGNYPENVSNDTSDTAGELINLVIIHVEEIIEKAYVSSWRRFSAPVSLLVRKEIEFNDLEKIVIAQLEAVYHCNIQSKLRTHLRFWVWDGLNNTDAEITSDYQFPLLTEAVESIVTWSDNSILIRMVAVWSPSNGARLMQTVFSNLRLSHSLGRDVSKIDVYTSRNTTQSLALMDAWSSIEENGSVELVTRATLSKRSQISDSRNISLEDCLKAYVSEEILDAKDAWKCPNCRKFQRATISNSIYSLPDILILHLKRFQSYSLTFNCNDGKSGRDHEDIALTTVGGNNTNSHSSSLLCENNSNNKLNILVDYPLSGLDMKSYLSIDAIKNSSKKIDSSDYFYDLIAVCNHQGTLSTGHYTAFCRSSVDFKWRSFNDDVVREVSTDKVIQANAYILFYQRRSSIVCSDQHWSSALNPTKPSDSTKNSSPQSYKTPNSDIRKYSNLPKGTEMKQTQNKSDPPIRRVPYQNKKISNLKNNDPIMTQLQHSSLHRPLPLDNNYNSIRNNTPIVDDDNEDDDDDGTMSQGSTSYDEYIPVSITKRPLKLQKNVRENNNPLYLSNSKSH